MIYLLKEMEIHAMVKKNSLRDLQQRFKGRTPYLCAHGTDELPDSLFQDLVKAGVSKVSHESSDPWLVLVS